MRGFRAVINYPGTPDLPGIIETPMEPEEMDGENLGMLRGLVREPMGRAKIAGL